MMNYEDALMLCDDAGLMVQEKPLLAYDGLIYDRYIAIRKTIQSEKEKSQVLAEEFAHHVLNEGNILDQSDLSNVKQEHRARDLAYDMKIGLDGLISAYKSGCRDKYEVAEHLDCTVDYLLEAIERYHQKYGLCAKHGNFVICFEPLSVIKLYGEG